MFGYVTTNMEEMKIKDYRKYRAFYCGVCQDLKEHHGQIIVQENACLEVMFFFVYNHGNKKITSLWNQ